MSVAGPRSAVLFAATLWVCLACGCSTLKPANVWLPPTQADWTFSEEVRAVLAKDQAIAAAEWAPAAAAVEISKRFAASPNSADALTIAELYHLAARRAKVVHARRAAEQYVRAAAFAGYVLTAPDGGLTPRALDLYNSCVAQLCDAGELDRASGGLRLEFHQQSLEVTSPRGPNELWTADDLDAMTPVGFYSVENVNPRYITLGVGAPVVAVRHRRENGDPRERYFAWWHPFAMTALLQFDRDSLLAFAADDAAPLAVRLEVYDPLRHGYARLGGSTVALASDISAPLAWAVLKAPTQGALRGFLRPESTSDHQGLYMIDRYQPGKIPVVFVHGLLSGPATWTHMINRFRADPTLRDRYQFWFFYYPTGIEFLESGRRLRSELRLIPQLFDPEGRDPAPWNMVLVGHSMGGLLSKLQVTNSGDDLWRSIAQVPVERLDASPETKERFRELFFFTPVKQVRKVVFIATPHQGSVWADRLIGRLGQRLVSLPTDMRRDQRQLLRNNRDVVSPEIETGTTSVQLLSPESPVLQRMMQLPFSSGVGLYGIIGVGHRMPRGESGDGVVSEQSATLPNYRRLVEVDEYHTRVHQTETAIEETRFILKDHLLTYDAFFKQPAGEEVAPISPADPTKSPEGRLEELLPSLE